MVEVECQHAHRLSAPRALRHHFIGGFVERAEAEEQPNEEAEEGVHGGVGLGLGLRGVYEADDSRSGIFSHATTTVTSTARQ